MSTNPATVSSTPRDCMERGREDERRHCKHCVCYTQAASELQECYYVNTVDLIISVRCAYCAIQTIIHCIYMYKCIYDCTFQNTHFFASFAFT